MAFDYLVDIRQQLASTDAAKGLSLVQTGTGVLAADVAAIGSSERTLVVGVGQALTSDVTVPANVTLQFVQGAILNTNGYTLTIEGEVRAGVHKIFAATSGAVRFPPGTTRQEYVRPEWWGPDGTADQSEINKAIDAFAQYGISDPGDQQSMTNWENVGTVLLTGRYTISAPIRAQTSTDVDGVARNGIVLDGMGVGVIEAASGFTGVPDYFDTISSAETVKAMVMLGAKDFGRDGGQIASYQQVRGLEFHGVRDGGGKIDDDLTAVWTGPATNLHARDLRFQDVAYCFRTRRIINSTLDHFEAYYVHAMIGLHNDQDAIATADPASAWASAVATNCNNNTITRMYGRTPLNVWNDNATTMARAAFELQNAGENILDGLTWFGGAHALHVWCDDGSHRKWNRFENMEFAGQEGWVVQFDDRRYDMVGKLQIEWAVQDTIASANIDYTAPYMILNDVHACTFETLIFDRDGSQAAEKGGHSLALTGTTYENTFGKVISSGGQSTEADATYSHVYIGGTSNNNLFGRMQLGVLAGSTKNFKHGVYLEDTAFGNNLGDVLVTHQTAERIVWGTGARNTRNQPVSRATAANGDTSPSVSNVKFLKFANNPSINVTAFSDPSPGQTLILADLNAATTPTTVVDSATVRLAGNWTPATNRDVLHLEYDGSTWFEVSRSTN